MHIINLMDVLIVDAGSTKTDWVVVNTHEKQVNSFKTEGINAMITPDSHIYEIIRKARAHLPYTVSAIHYYGAGCSSAASCSRVSEMLQNAFGTLNIEVNSDLLGAARALLQRDKGIACILGTGSNSCLYDGHDITDNVPSLGFILGDEGSGNALGKRLISDVFKRILPDDLCSRFKAEYNIDVSGVIEKIYREPNPNKFLASTVPFIHKNIRRREMHKLVYEEFEKFFERNISRYPEAKSIPISFTGSVSVIFEDILQKAASDGGYKISAIVQRPIEGLIEYHIKNYEK